MTDYNVREEMLEKAKHRALYLLEKMPRTEAQLREKLQNTKTGYPEDVIEEVIAYAKEYHYIDDAAYAREYIRCRADKKSRRMIFMELERKGISGTLAGEALAALDADGMEKQVTFEEQQREAIFKLIRKKKFDPGTADREELGKFCQSVYRRGFSYGEIKEAIERFLEEQ